MTALTGETGAGKTALVGALKLLLGERADSGDVRHGSARDARRRAVPSRRNEEIVAKRRVTADGRSRCTIDGEHGHGRRARDAPRARGGPPRPARPSGAAASRDPRRLPRPVDRRAGRAGARRVPSRARTPSAKRSERAGPRSPSALAEAETADRATCGSSPTRSAPADPHRQARTTSSSPAFPRCSTARSSPLQPRRPSRPSGTRGALRTRSRTRELRLRPSSGVDPALDALAASLADVGSRAGGRRCRAAAVPRRHRARSPRAGRGDGSALARSRRSRRSTGRPSMMCCAPGTRRWRRSRRSIGESRVWPRRTRASRRPKSAYRAAAEALARGSRCREPRVRCRSRRGSR